MISGVYDDLTNEAYHHGEGVSKSDLDLVHRSPAHYRAIKGMISLPTAAMKLGTAFHCAVLEPDRFSAEYIVAPESSKRTKAGKEERQALEASGKTLLEKADMDTILAMRDSVMANEIARHLIEKSTHELSVFGEIDGVLCKCRPDGWLRNEGIVIDLKSAMDASMKGFQRAIKQGRYYVQDAWYRAVIKAACGESVEAFYFIACEKEPPYAMAIYQIDPMSVEFGYTEALTDLTSYKNAIETGEWPAYPPTIQAISLSRWDMA